MQGRKRIGDYLLEAGLITQEQLEIALKEQKKTGELLGAILFGLGYISQKDLHQVLSLSRGSAQTPPDSEIGELPDEIEHLVKQSKAVFEGEKGAGRKAIDVTQPPLVRLVEKIITTGITKGATDIHVGPDMKGTRVRYRVDGLLQHNMYVPADLLNPIVSRFKILGNMNIAESRVPQDGGAEFALKSRKLDLRISTFPVLGGENVVVRLLDKSQIRVGLENIGFLTGDALAIQEILKLPYGMVLVTGPTGSGKTTTLYSCLSMVNTVSKNIFTIEDPVEYQMPLVRQSQVNVKAGLTFATGLRSILRQDPDIILVGEIRDTETAELAVRAALTGHLVFSTLHTNDALSSIVRLLDMGLDPFLVSGTLDAVIAQRLIRLLCPECKENIPAGDALYKQLDITPGTQPLYRAKGCERCGNIGYSGRTVIYEIFKITPVIKGMINDRAGLEDIKREAVRNGFVNMYESGLKKVKMGVTTIEEVGSAARTGE